MNTNSRAYKDAWARVRAAIAAEAEAREICLTDAALDDMASEATYAAFGLGDDSDEPAKE